jgi:hypothetical protein
LESQGLHQDANRRVGKFVFDKLAKSNEKHLNSKHIEFSIAWIGDENYLANYQFWIEKAGGNAARAQEMIEAEVHRTGRSFGDILLGLGGNDEIVENYLKAFQKEPKFDYVLIGGGTGSNKMAQKFSSKKPPSKVSILAAVNDDGGDSRNKMDAILKSVRFGNQIIPPGDIINAWSGFVESLKYKLLGVRFSSDRVYQMFKTKFELASAKDGVTTPFDVRSVTDFKAGIDVIASKVKSDEFRNKIRDVLADPGMTDADLILQKLFDILMNDEWAASAQAIMADKLMFARRLLMHFGHCLSSPGTGMKHRRIFYRDFFAYFKTSLAAKHDTLENNVKKNLLETEKKARKETERLTKAIQSAEASKQADLIAERDSWRLPDDWIFFANSLLNISRVVDREFVKPSETPPVFNLSGSSIRNLLLLGIWVDRQLLKKA